MCIRDQYRLSSATSPDDQDPGDGAYVRRLRLPEQKHLRRTRFACQTERFVVGETRVVTSQIAPSTLDGVSLNRKSTTSETSVRAAPISIVGMPSERATSSGRAR